MSEFDSLPVEIERKFLVTDLNMLTPYRGSRPDPDKLFEGGQYIHQGYLVEKGHTIRVRQITEGAGEVKSYLTIKDKVSKIEQLEFEYLIPNSHAEHMLTGMCGNRTIVKYRHVVMYKDITVEVDVFDGALFGMVIAEIEFKHIDHPAPEIPWFGREVTGNKEYKNKRLAVSQRIPKSYRGPLRTDLEAVRKANIQWRKSQGLELA